MQKLTAFVRSSALYKVVALLVLLGAATLLSATLAINNVNIALLYLLCVLLVCVVTGSNLYGMCAAICCAVLYNLLFLPPVGGFELTRADDLLTIAFYLVVSLVAGALATQLQRRAWQAEESARRADLLARTGQGYLTMRGEEAVVRHGQSAIFELVGAECTVYLAGADGGLRPPLRFGAVGGEDENDPWVRRCFEEWRAGSPQPGPGAPGWENLPLAGGERLLGVAAVRLGERRLNEADRSYLKAAVTQLSLSLEREKLSAEGERIQLEVEKEKLRSSFLRSISHDLRTPLTGIAATVDYVARNAAVIDRDELGGLMRDVDRDAVWMNNMVTNLLHLTRIQEGRLLVKKVPEVVDDVAADALERTRRLRCGRRVEAHLPDELLTVPMDGLLIRQVLCNLLDNAFGHTRPDTAVRLTVSRRGQDALFAVEDDGGGIPPALLPHIFEGLVSEESATADGKRGMGLGLMVCAAIVQAHGGAIWAENNARGGAGFFFTLPLREEEESAHA